MEYAKDPRVDHYIEALPAWQQAICRQVRDLVHATDPDVVETIKRTVQPYFVLDGNICALLAAKDQRRQVTGASAPAAGEGLKPASRHRHVTN